MSSLNTQMESDKLDRKSLKRPDQFMRTVSSLFTELSKHQQGLLAGVAIVLALGLVGAFIAQRKGSHADEAKNRYYEAEKSFVADVKAAGTVGKGEVDTKLSASVAKFKAISDQALDPLTTYEAQMKLGEIYLKYGDSAVASGWFEKAYKSATNALGKALAVSAQGYAEESSAQYTKAISLFQKAIDMGEPTVKVDLLFSMARNQELAKDKAKAQATYDQIISQFPGTEQAKRAEILKAKGAKE